MRIPCRYVRWALALFLALASAADASSAGPDWDKAMIVGGTPGDRICYGAGEEIEFTLRLVGVIGELPPDTYFVDWSRRGEDGVVEKGRAALPHPKDGIKVKTKMAVPGCVFLEANVVTADGKRVPKKHRWEPRVFFQGGACVEREAIRGGTEPADYDEFWTSCMAQLSKVPMKAKVEKVVVPDDKADCYSLRIDCAGPRPVTGYMTMPKRVGDRKFPLTVGYCGASHNNLNPPSRGSHDSIHIDITVPGFDLGRDDAYLKEFFKTICLSGNEYGFSPEQLKDRDDCYWKWVILRAVRVLQWATALPEWNGKDLSLSAGSQGAWQALHAAALFHKVTEVTANIAWGCDWTGQAEIPDRLRSTYRPKCWFPAMAYFDPVFAARRIKCPVSLVARMGDTCSPPTSLTALYNELCVPKSITYQQGRSHGWSPDGMAVESVSDRCAAPLDMVRAAVSRGEKSVSVPKARYFVAPREGEKTYLKLTGLKDVTIDFNGSELVGLVRARMLALSGCTNVTIRNVTVDYAPLPFTQGRIEKVGKGGEWDVRILGGYPCPTAKAVAQVGNAWPIQAYDGKTLELKNPMRFRDGIKIEKTGLDTYRITGGLDRRGDVGDIAVFSCKEDRMATDTSAVTDNRCVDITWENVTVYSTPHGVGFYDELSEKTVFRNCRLVPRPPETDIDKRELRRLRSGNHDAFMCRGAVVGPQIINCAALYHCDDCVNIGGKYAVVVKKEGRTLRVLADGIGASIGEGHPLQIFAYDGRVLPEATAASVRRVGGRTAEELAFLKGQTLWPSLAESCSIALAVTLDRDMEVPLGSLVISRRHTGDGFVVKGCHFGRNRARGMILQASDGVVEDNFIDHPYDLGMKISMSYLWLEGSCGSNIKVRGNRIEKDGGGTGIYVGGTPGAKGGRIPSDAHRNISFLDNVISGVGCGLDITGCTDVVLDGNDIKVSKGKGPPVILRDVKNVRRDADAARTPKDLLVEVNSRIEREFISADGLMLDYVGEIPTPEEIADLRPNAMGWWSPVENGSMFTGEWLPSLMAEGEVRKPLVERCVRGLLKMSEISDVPGFIARGTGTDGVSHHPCGSNDQTDPWFLGLIEYCRWQYADPKLKTRVLDRLVFVARALEANQWGVPCDGAFKGENRGNLMSESMPFWGKSRLMYTLKSLSLLTGDEHWENVYGSIKAGALDDIESGGEADVKVFKTCYSNGVWIYVSSVQSLARLVSLEENESDRTRIKKGLLRFASRVAPLMRRRADYANTCERPFKYANWRTGYKWRPQKTQKDAESVACSGNIEILGRRKEYERNRMSVPLAAAAICALADRDMYREEILLTLRHYDYTTPNISEFFHAAIAASAL